MLFQQYLPDLFAHFEKEGIETSFYATRWFLTLWGDTLPLPVVVRIWDLFLYEGPRVIYSVGIGLLQLSKGILHFPHLSHVARAELYRNNGNATRVQEDVSRRKPGDQEGNESKYNGNDDQPVQGWLQSYCRPCMRSR